VSRRDQRRHEQGAVAVEMLIAFVPVLLFFASTWQLLHVYAAELIVRRAASAAGRAASVVLPDDPYWYGGASGGTLAGTKQAQIELAAQLVLSASNFLAQPEVHVEPGAPSGDGPVTVRVTAQYICFPAFSLFVCGADGLARLSARARYPYHGASYAY
jgi:hypothetical protein